jgi:hypothetical protein
MYFNRLLDQRAGIIFSISLDIMVFNAVMVAAAAGPEVLMA